MSLTLSLEAALGVVQQAFLPHRCETTAHNEDASFAFRVFDDSAVELLSQCHVAPQPRHR